MIIVSFIYSDHEGATFDEAYYRDKHLPRVRELWGSRGLQSVTPYVSLDGKPSSGPYRAMSILNFTSLDAYNDALANGGEELIADIANFTNIQPAAQISRPL